MLTSARHAESTSTWTSDRSRTMPRPLRCALDDCFAQAPVRQLKAKEPLFAEGDTKSNVYKIESGAV